MAQQFGRPHHPHPYHEVPDAAAQPLAKVAKIGGAGHGGQRRQFIHAPGVGRVGQHSLQRTAQPGVLQGADQPERPVRIAGMGPQPHGQQHLTQGRQHSPRALLFAQQLLADQAEHQTQRLLRLAGEQRDAERARQGIQQQRPQRSLIAVLAAQKLHLIAAIAPLRQQPVARLGQGQGVAFPPDGMGLASGQQQQIARPQGHVIALRRGDPDLSFH
ncbi:hypothetical protein D3C77_418490 [compost metagenome]